MPAAGGTPGAAAGQLGTSPHLAVNQSISQSINQSISKSINRLYDQLIHQFIYFTNLDTADCYIRYLFRATGLQNICSIRQIK